MAERRRSPYDAEIGPLHVCIRNLRTWSRLCAVDQAPLREVLAQLLVVRRSSPNDHTFCDTRGAENNQHMPAPSSRFGTRTNRTGTCQDSNRWAFVVSEPAADLIPAHSNKCRVQEFSNAIELVTGNTLLTLAC